MALYNKTDRNGKLLTKQTKLRSVVPRIIFRVTTAAGYPKSSIIKLPASTGSFPQKPAVLLFQFFSDRDSRYSRFRAASVCSR